MISAALVVIIAAMLLVRFGWAGRRGMAPAGWALAAGALIMLSAEAGAWGVALGAVVGTFVAIACVLHAGWTSPSRDRRVPREAPAITLPLRGTDLARRLAVFVLVVPVAFAAAQWLAFAAHALARRAGVGEADATVLALFLQPTLWAALMAWQMAQAGAGRMIAAPAIAALAGTLLWGLA